MKSFLKYLGIIFLSTGVMMILLDEIYTYVFQNNPPRNKIQNILQLKDKHYDLVFLGSSRTENHINCAFIEKMTGKSCVNLGVSGATLGDMLLLLKSAEANNVTFEKIFLQIDYNFNKNGTSPYFEANLVPFLDAPFLDQQFSEGFENFLLKDLPFYRYMINDKIVGIREMIASATHRTSGIDLKYGFWPQDFTGTRVVGNFPESVAAENRELKEIKKMCHETGSELILFTAPFCNKTDTKNFMTSLEKKLPELYNYAKLFENKSEYFADCSHLNRTGAQAFTEKFMNDLVRANVIP